MRLRLDAALYAPARVTGQWVRVKGVRLPGLA